MRYTSLCLLLLTSLNVKPAMGRAQSLADVRAGNRVQLTILDSLRPTALSFSRQTIIGHFVRSSADSVWIRPVGASEMGVARINIKRAEESLGASRTRSALVYGFAVGLSLAATISVDMIDSHNDHRGRDALIAGGIGFGGGVIIGAVRPFEHWRGLRR
ncbi:MAG: hypothetical protein U0132_19555 [Gemmatimonadaceae bacterium]